MEIVAETEYIFWNSCWCACHWDATINYVFKCLLMNTISVTSNVFICSIYHLPNVFLILQNGRNFIFDHYANVANNFKHPTWESWNTDTVQWLRVTKLRVYKTVKFSAKYIHKSKITMSYSRCLPLASNQVWYAAVK